VLKGDIKMVGKVYKANEARLVQDFVNKALRNWFWIYQSAGKHWYIPEEFLDYYNSGYLSLNGDWHDRYKIMNPQRGLAAAEIMVQELHQKRNAFNQRIITKVNDHQQVSTVHVTLFSEPNYANLRRKWTQRQSVRMTACYVVDTRRSRSFPDA